MLSPRTRRLILEEQALEQRLRNWPRIQITGKAGMPPEMYRCTYKIRGLYVAGSGEILERDTHVLEVSLSRLPAARASMPNAHSCFPSQL